MFMNKRKMIQTVLFSFGIMSLLAACTFSNDIANVDILTGEESVACINELPVEYVSADFAIDIDEPTEVIGMADYVFVAKINKILGTSYNNCKTVERDSGDMEIYDVFTNYQVTVIDNIKGNLKKNTPIEIAKEGGISKDKTCIELYDGDTLPKEGKYYILVGIAQPDGTLLISGPNSNILLNAQNKSDIVSDKGYKDYKKFYKYEKKYDIEHFSSKYEE